MTDNMIKILVALEAKATVKNHKGERISLPNKIDNRSNDCVKCHVLDLYYWSTAAVQKSLFVDGKPFDEWFEQAYPINIDTYKSK